MTKMRGGSANRVRSQSFVSCSCLWSFSYTNVVFEQMFHQLQHKLIEFELFLLIFRQKFDQYQQVSHNIYVQLVDIGMNRE